MPRNRVRTAYTSFSRARCDRRWDTRGSRVLEPPSRLACLRHPSVLLICRCMRLFFTVVVFAGTLVTGADWLRDESAHLTVFYQSGFETDSTFARTWWDAANRLAEVKYRVRVDGYAVAVYLHPDPTPEADTSHALIRCCPPPERGIRTATIDYLSPSAPAWNVGTLRSSLGIPKNSADYHAKVLMSEYVPVVYRIVQDARQSGGWRGDAPQWFVQGLEEYDAIFHTTEFNRTETAKRLFAWAKRNRDVFQCCKGGLQVTDAYNGGATVMAFLASESGEDIHRRLLASPAPTFAGALDSQNTGAVETWFSRFNEWLDRLP
jgi:hypothetical protein